MYIPYGKQSISEEDIQSVVDVLESDWLTQGPVVPNFESEVARIVGCKHAVASNSATSSLHLACRALEIGKGDLVWTSPISFVASSNCALYCGANIDFVDIDIKTYNMDVCKLEEKLELAKANDNLPKCVIPVHLAGRSCDMASIYKLSKKYGFKIIEDASHGVGASYQKTKVGSCRYSDITVFSFHPVKIITSGEGGMALTNDHSLATKMALLRSHGITRDEKIMDNISDGSWYYEQLDLGFNYRLTDIAAALGLSQLNRLSAFVEQRNAIADRYDELLADSNFILPSRDSDSLSSFHLYIIRIESSNPGQMHKALFEKLRSSGVGVNLHYIPIYRHPYYQKIGFDYALYPASEAYYKSAISIPMFPGLSYEEQDFVVKVLQNPSGYQNIF
jgi:UDP-4-amino-4,6-dideoxy-N-acetyl-beta-L-altrosamine transaminase